MREIARVQQGFFPTQDRIVRAIAKLLNLPSERTGINVIDAGCGTGKAIFDLRSHWLVRQPNHSIYLHGIESDKSRYEKTASLLSPLAGSSVLWANIEDTYVEGSVNLLWFNPPYDRIRGAGRSELSLYRAVKDWPARGTGLLLFIVSDSVLADRDSGMAVAVERDYQVLGLWRYPEPEYQEFKQCVLLGRRREKALNHTRLLFPRWAENPAAWPILGDSPRPVATLAGAKGRVRLLRARLSPEIVRDTLQRSPLHGSLLCEAIAPAPPMGRPLLPLRNGHLALALAGGLCDGIIESAGKRFLIKGSLASAVRKVATKESVNAEGDKVAEIDVYRTRHEMTVRCLLEDGTLEEYSSAEAAEEQESDDGEEVNDDDDHT